MSDLVPETPFNGLVRVVKLINGDELVGLVSELQHDKITLVMPAKIESGFSRDSSNNVIQYVKMINYASNVQNFEIKLHVRATMYIAHPTPDVLKMYEAFVVAIKSDPQTIISNHTGDMGLTPEPGLQLLNDLFNNEDFVEFVNNLIDSYEGDVLFEDIEEEIEETPNILPESSTIDPHPEEPEKASKKKKRSKMKPRTTELPFNPEGPPNSAESWSDNPEDYL